MSSIEAGWNSSPTFSRDASDEVQSASEVRLRLIPDEAEALNQIASVVGIDRASDYRKSRKYTAFRLAELARDCVSEVRDAIGSTATGPLLASELVTFLLAQEQTIPAWKLKKLPPLDGVPRKRGRPRKRPPTSAGG